MMPFTPNGWPITRQKLAVIKANISKVRKRTYKLLLYSHYSGAPRLARPPRPGPCLYFGFQYALMRNNRSKKFGVEYWALSGSNSLWRPWPGWKVSRQTIANSMTNIRIKVKLGQNALLWAVFVLPSSASDWWNILNWVSVKGMEGFLLYEIFSPGL